MKYKIVLGTILMFFPIFCLADLVIPQQAASLYSEIASMRNIDSKLMIISIIVVVMLIVSLLEAYILKLLVFKEFSKSLKLALIVNLITTFLGGFVPISPLKHPSVNEIIALFTPFFMGSFLVEFLLLKLFAKNYRWKNIILASFCANLTSYVLLICLLLFVLQRFGELR